MVQKALALEVPLLETVKVPAVPLKEVRFTFNDGVPVPVELFQTFKVVQPELVHIGVPDGELNTSNMLLLTFVIPKVQL